MEEIKIGDSVLINVKIVEIRIAEKGRYYRVEVSNENTYNDFVVVDEKNVIKTTA